ncbi:MAG: hypothetical protein ACPGLY_05500 [Rubripirellula sp.]
MFSIHFTNGRQQILKVSLPVGRFAAARGASRLAENGIPTTGIAFELRN